MTREQPRSGVTSFRYWTALFACSVPVILLAACGGGGGPTAPALEAPASIGGQVVTSSAASSRGPASGVTVRVEGTELSTSTDGQGLFSLAGVPSGDQVLSFEQSGQTAILAINGIQPAENIRLVVALLGSTVQVQSLDRGTGTTTGGAAVDIEKATNGDDADLPPGPSIPIGEPVEWTYIVTNTGGAALADVEVADDQGVIVSCPQPTLAPGESMTCTGSGAAVAGQYANTGTVVAADGDGNRVEDSDPSHYFGVEPVASIDIEKSTNGEDADKAPGPTVTVGETVVWEYLVLNDGGTDLVDVVVSDDQGVLVQCPTTNLASGESMTCTAEGIAVEGQYANLGTVTAVDGGGNVVGDEDPSHYFGEAGTQLPFSVDIQSDNWNTNWPGSSGTVSAKIQNGDLASVETDSIVLFENDPLVSAMPTNQPRITGNHIRAQFAKSDAFAILENPQTGETRTVVVQFVANGVVVQLEAQIRIVGPAI